MSIPQFTLPIPAGDTRAPLTLDIQTASTSAPDCQPDLLQVPSQPAARDLDQWLSRLPPATRRRLERKFIRGQRPACY